MPLALPDVTIVCIDNVAQALAGMALHDTLRLITPAAVLFWTDEVLEDLVWLKSLPLAKAGDGEPDVVRVIPFRVFPFFEHGKEAADQPLWYQAPYAVKTSHFLTVQWDGWVLDAQAWDPAFLDYDYIGAPWHWHPPGSQVGNGGFSLRSRRLMEFLAERRKRFRYSYPEDDVICRRYRPALEAEGFRFAPVELAFRFSFEHGRPSDFPTFGYHDFRNWGWIFSDAQIDARLAAASAYILNKQELLDQMVTMRDHIRGIQARMARR